jgi:hypothetical protein|tara:strand:+ start:3472 stop:3573 length:102 start_codon:yes stop_codon:yes gene_type:complete
MGVEAIANPIIKAEREWRSKLWMGKVNLLVKKK